MKQNNHIRTLALLGFLVSCSLTSGHAAKVGEEFILNRIQPVGSSSWWYGPENGQDKSFVMNLDQVQGLIELRGKDGDEKNRTMVRFDKQGRISSYEATGRTIQSTYLENSVETLMLAATGKKQRIKTRELILDAGFACFGAGAFALYKPGDEVGFRASPPQDPAKDLEIGEYECYLKVVGRSSQTSPAGTFKCLDLELGFKGVAGLFAPKMLVWLDESSRRMVAFKMDLKDQKNNVRLVVQAIGP